MGLETATLTSLGSLAAKGIGAGISFQQASKQKKLMEEAELAAQKAIERARGELSTNYMAGLSIAMEPYDLEREAMIQSAAQAIEAARESDRGIGTIPLIQRQAQEAQRKIRGDMASEIQRLNQIAATEDSRLAEARAKLDQIEAFGAQQAAAYREDAANTYMNQMAGLIGSSMGDIAGLIPTKYDLPIGRGDNEVINMSSRRPDISFGGIPETPTTINPSVGRPTRVVGPYSGRYDIIDTSGLRRNMYGIPEYLIDKENG